MLIDGKMTEASWQNADVATNFFMALPMDTSFAEVRTDVRMTYDANNLYILVINFHEPGQKYTVESLKRDWLFGRNDNFIFFMDPFNDLTHGFTFGANAAGAQWDGMLYEGGKADLSWENIWTSEVRNENDRWIFEASIPFKSIRFKKGITTWGINVSRLDVGKAEKSSWAPVPRQFPTASLAYTGNLVWDAPPPETGSNISFIPYLLSGVSKNHETGSASNWRKDIGGDAKLAITSALNLDLTVNPDFSQVEVDRQVTNLDRYELFFPERRQFFLENGDLFANFGYPSIRPFFSRRIGLNTPIQFGARMSGKLNKDWRIGVMDIQTDKMRSLEMPVQNYSVIALQRKVFSRSNIGFLMVNKQAVNYELHDTAKQVFTRYNRNFGIEYNLASSNNLWTGKMLLLKSFSPGVNGKNLVNAGNLLYSSKRWNIGAQYEIVTENYSAEVGYVPRRNYIKFNPTVSHLFFNKGGVILNHGPKIISNRFFDMQLKSTDHETALMYVINFRNQAYFDTWVGRNYVELLHPFVPTNFGKDTLAKGSTHAWSTWNTTFISKPQSVFTFGFTTKIGGYYANGKLMNFTADAGYRFQPFVNIALNTSFSHIALPAPWNINNFWMIGPKVDITFTNKLFFTTYLQYNSQLENINLNTRFQWRYRPASDLFIVYTDNYYPSPFNVRNRAFVLKLNYWWNL